METLRDSKVTSLETAKQGVETSLRHSSRGLCIHMLRIL